MWKLQILLFLLGIGLILGTHQIIWLFKISNTASPTSQCKTLNKNKIAYLLLALIVLVLTNSYIFYVLIGV